MKFVARVYPNKEATLILKENNIYKIVVKTPNSIPRVAEKGKWKLAEDKLILLNSGYYGLRVLIDGRGDCEFVINEDFTRLYFNGYQHYTLKEVKLHEEKILTMGVNRKDTIKNQTASQNLFFGLPNNNQIINSGDLIILNIFDFDGKTYQFSDIGTQQIKELATFLSQIKANKIEIRIYFYDDFYYSNVDFCQNISQKFSEELHRLLIKENVNLKKILDVKPCGNQRLLFCRNEKKIRTSRMNTRVEIELQITP